MAFQISQAVPGVFQRVRDRSLLVFGWSCPRRLLGGGNRVVSFTRCGVEEALDNRTNSIDHQLLHGGCRGGRWTERGGDVINAASDNQLSQDQYEKSVHQILDKRITCDVG